jgi:hypothetical protein
VHLLGEREVDNDGVREAKMEYPVGHMLQTMGPTISLCSPSATLDDKR